MCSSYNRPVNVGRTLQVYMRLMLKSSGIILTDHSKAVVLLWIIFIICASCLTYCLVCILIVTCWERADLLALFCVMFSCAFFFSFPYGVLGWVWYLILLIPDRETFMLSFDKILTC